MFFGKELLRYAPLYVLLIIGGVSTPKAQAAVNSICVVWKLPSCTA